MSGMVECARCAQTLPDSALFCPKCGTPHLVPGSAAANAKICPKCGTQKSARAKFCRNDGASLSTVVPAGEEPSQAGVEEEANTSSPSTVPLEAPPVGTPCPQCGTAYPPSTRFCPKDGALLLAAPMGVTHATQPADSTAELVDEARPSAMPRASQAEPAMPSGRLRRPLLVLLAAGAVVAIAIAGYFVIPSHPAFVQRQLNTSLAGAGLAHIVAKVDDDLAATLSGSANTAIDKEVAIRLVRQNEKVTNVLDAITVLSGGAPSDVGRAVVSRVAADVSNGPSASEVVPAEAPGRPAEGTVSESTGAREAARGGDREPPLAPQPRPTTQRQVAATPPQVAEGASVPASAVEAAPTSAPSAPEVDPSTAAAAGTTVDQFNEINDLIGSVERLSKQAREAHEDAGREDDALWAKLDGFVEAARATRKEFRKATGTGLGGVLTNVSNAVRRNRGSRDADNRVIQISVEDLVRRGAEIDALNTSGSTLGATAGAYWQEASSALVRLSALVGK